MSNNKQPQEKGESLFYISMLGPKPRVGVDESRPARLAREDAAENEALASPHFSLGEWELVILGIIPGLFGERVVEYPI